MTELKLDGIFGDVRRAEPSPSQVTGIGVAADGPDLYITIMAGGSGGLAVRLSGDQVDRFCTKLANAVFAANRNLARAGQGGETMQ